jgi:hypothetical protein
MFVWIEVRNPRERVDGDQKMVDPTLFSFLPKQEELLILAINKK